MTWPPEPVDAALDLLRDWLSRDAAFWPKEEAIQGWFCAALREAKFAAKPMEIIQEVHFGEAEHESADARLALAAFLPTKERSGHIRFDVVVLGRTEGEPPACGDGRNLEMLTVKPRLVAEMKALNSAGKLENAKLLEDIRKLQAAKRYLDKKFPDGDCIFLMLIVATARHGVSDDTTGSGFSKHTMAKFGDLDGWVTRQSEAAAASSAPGVSIRLVLHRDYPKL